MKKEYQAIISKGKSQYEANKKFLKLLAKRKVSGFDIIIHEMHDDVFSQINCTECANCCRKLGPLFNETDIDRISGVFRMKNSEFTSRYLRTDEDGDLVFKAMPCPFSQSDKLCSIYDVKPKACRTYPHTDEKNIQNKLTRLLSNTLFCPAVVLIVEKMREKFR